MCSAALQCNWLNGDNDASVADDNDGVTYGIIAGFAILALMLIGGVWWQRKLRRNGRAEIQQQDGKGNSGSYGDVMAEPATPTHRTVKITRVSMC